MLIFTEPIDILKGVTYEHAFYFVSNDRTPVDPSPYTPYLQIESSSGIRPNRLDLSEFLDVETLKDQGIVLLTLTTSFTSNMDSIRGHYDLLLAKDGGDTVYKICGGKVTTQESISRVVMDA